jgi:hypothetical protein
MKGVVAMKTRLGVAVAFVVVVATFSVAYAETPTTPHYSHAEVRKMVHDAHTVQQYQALAAYFRAQQGSYEQQAQSEKQEWERRSQNVYGLAAKYPRPVDSSKNRYEYFSYEADQMSQQAAHFDSLSEAAR